MAINQSVRARGFSHSKLILIGEHAVVYDQPAIAIPFDAVSAEVTIYPKAGPVELISDFYQGRMTDLPTKMQGLKEIVSATCEKLHQQVKDFSIELTSTIPIGRGLGSSAAIATSIIRGLFNYFERDLSLKTLRDLVDVSETYAHGTPSGIDREAVINDEPIWFQKGELIEPIELSVPLNIVVADTGRIGDTHLAVTSVKDRLQEAPLATEQSFDKLGKLAREVRTLLKTGELTQLGERLVKAHQELKALGVSDPGLDHYVEVSLLNGALGAKLTGGGRGGCMFALCASAEATIGVEAALKNAGAKETWSFQLTSGVMTHEKNSSRTH
ncbi:mevalonate kinase [Streptohalobacillus salinus]|uniref:mevalonate kinase n=1 Tax=Streptohalobacillus salinus TaxID=621096 RepID=A0A2V3WA13_9BACI|nr:mevalonate kinase [Streptohalobacillus salinus]PXW90910.1 mevalonate kinase [Streptohalobacillus salinus]